MVKIKEIEKNLNIFIEENFEDYFYNVKNNFVFFENIGFNDFKKNMIYLLLNDEEEHTTKTIIKDNFLYTSHLNGFLNIFIDKIDDKSINDLLNFDVENVYDYCDFFNSIKEDLKIIFFKDIEEYFKSSYDDLYINIPNISIKEDLKNIKDICELENIIYDININDLIIKYLYFYNYEVLNYYCDTNLLDKDNENLIKKIEVLRIEKLKEKLKNNLNLINFNKKRIGILRDELKRLIKNKKTTIEELKTNVKNIKDFLKNNKNNIS